MAGNDYICGVSWSIMKRIAKFTFGDANCEHFKKVGKNTFIVYINSEVYLDKRGVVEHFEDTWKVTIKPISTGD